MENKNTLESAIDKSIFIPSMCLLVHSNDNQLKKIKSILPINAEIKSLGSDLYKIVPEVIACNVTQILNNITLRELSGKYERNEKIYDFKESSEFYKASRKEKAFKIVKDDFSNYRNARLYGGFNLIEIKWRQFILINLGASKIKEAPNPTFYKNKEADHKISQYSISEFLENFFYQPASENYIRSCWGKSAKNEDSLIKLMKLQKLDEFDFPLSAIELAFMNQIRNQCMHFRVTSMEDYTKSIEILNRYLKYEAQKELGKVAVDILKPYLDIQKDIADLVNNTLKPLRDMTQKTQESQKTLKSYLGKISSDLESIMLTVRPPKL